MKTTMTINEKRAYTQIFRTLPELKGIERDAVAYLEEIMDLKGRGFNDIPDATIEINMAWSDKKVAKVRKALETAGIIVRKTSKTRKEAGKFNTTRTLRLDWTILSNLFAQSKELLTVASDTVKNSEKNKGFNSEIKEAICEFITTIATADEVIVEETTEVTAEKTTIKKTTTVKAPVVAKEEVRVPNFSSNTFNTPKKEETTTTVNTQDDKMIKILAIRQDKDLNEQEKREKIMLVMRGVA